MRSHWTIENSLHWTLDVVFREDDSRMRPGSSAEHFTMMRRIALSLVKRDTTSKRSLKRRRRIRLYDDDYLERLMFNTDDELARSPGPTERPRMSLRPSELTPVATTTALLVTWPSSRDLR